MLWITLLSLLISTCNATGWREQASKFFFRPRPVKWDEPGDEALEITSIGQHKHRSQDFRMIVHEELRGLKYADRDRIELVTERWWKNKLKQGYLAITGRKPRARNGQDVVFLLNAPARMAVGICDGHGTEGSSMAENACKEIMARARRNDTFPQQLISFSRGPVLSDEVVGWFSTAMSAAHKATSNGRLSGTTATVAIAAAVDSAGHRMNEVESDIFVALSNIGDTRAALFQFDGVSSSIPSPSTHYSVKRLSDEHSYSRASEIAHAERQLLKLGLREGLSFVLRGLVGTTNMRMFASPEGNSRLDDAWRKMRYNFGSGDAPVNALLRIARESNEPLWALTQQPTLRGTRSVLRLFHPGGTMMELEPSASFGDAWMKPVHKQFPDTVRGARLVPSSTASTLVVVASDGVWEALDNARSSGDHLAGDVRIADVLAKGAAAGGSLDEGLQAVYHYARSQGSKDDITIHAWWFPLYEVSPLLPSIPLPYDSNASSSVQAATETELPCPFTNPGVGVEQRRIDSPEQLPHNPQQQQPRQTIPSVVEVSDDASEDDETPSKGRGSGSTATAPTFSVVDVPSGQKRDVERRDPGAIAPHEHLGG